MNNFAFYPPFSVLAKVSLAQSKQHSRNKHFNLTTNQKLEIQPDDLLLIGKKWW